MTSQSVGGILGAIVAAIVDFNRRKRMADLVKFSGCSDTMMTNEEIEAIETQEFRQQSK